MFKYSCSLLLIFISLQGNGKADTTSVISDTAQMKKQFRFGIEILQPILNQWSDSKYGYSLILDFSLPKDLYVVAEGGWGGSEMDEPQLKYSSNNYFLRVGVDKSMLPRLFPEDWDYLFVGIRYAIAFIDRSEAAFRTSDGFWGSSSGRIPPKSYTGHWAELTAGLRVELLQGLFAGYTVRGKFFLNREPFRELPPLYLAGYGNGERNTAFDFNFYLQYALRW